MNQAPQGTCKLSRVSGAVECEGEGVVEMGFGIAHSTAAPLERNGRLYSSAADLTYLHEQRTARQVLYNKPLSCPSTREKFQLENFNDPRTATRSIHPALNRTNTSEITPLQHGPTHPIGSRLCERGGGSSRRHARPQLSRCHCARYHFGAQRKTRLQSTFHQHRGY